MALKSEHAKAEHDGPEPSESEPRATPEEIAAEYIARLSEGEPVDERAFLARLGGDAARAEFEALVRGAERAERSLPRALSAGTEISQRYRLLSKIGQGGMGCVFAAFDLQLERKVAVKVLSSQNMGQKDLEALFLKESKLLASLNHPNIVSVHESGRDGELSYIVMDLVDGTSIANVIERAREELKATSKGNDLTPREGRLLERAIGRKTPDGRENLIDASDWYASVARIMLEIARTTESAHGLRVIHRDLKPGNVMLTGGGNPVVLDFGLAGSSDLKPGTVTQGLYGSVAYLAPEQAHSNQVGMDPRTDVYQLGLIFYELLTLHRAFPGTAIGEVLGRIKDGIFPAPRKQNPAVPRELESVCMMALEVDPARRYASAKDLREDLERCVDGDAVPVAMRSDRWRTISRASRHYLRSHPWAVALSATLAASILVWMVTKDRALQNAAAALLISAFKLPPGANRPVPINDGDPVSFGDNLGVTVSTNRKQFVYALSVFRSADDQRYFAPMRGTTLERKPVESEKEPPDGLRPWAFEALPGLTHRICTDIDDERNKLEGLIVYLGAEERTELEEWLGQLRRRMVERKVAGIPESEAWDVLTKPEVARGGDPGDLTPAELQARYKNLREAALSPGVDVELPGLHRFKLECPVEKAK